MVICVGVSEATGYSLGTLGQMHIPSHRASVLYGLEGAFATFFGFIFLGKFIISYFISYFLNLFLIFYFIYFLYLIYIHNNN